jgi:hypothetical protein
MRKEVMGSGMTIDLFIPVLMHEHREEIHLAGGRAVGLGKELPMVMGSGMTIDLFMPVLMPEHREEIHLAKQVNTHA